MGVVDTTSRSVKEPLPGWKGRFFHSERMTFAYYDIEPDAVDLHEHEHPQEEVWHILDGELAVTVDGEEHVAGPGCAVIVPPSVRHSARVVGRCRAIVVDTPRRDSVGQEDVSS